MKGKWRRWIPVGIAGLVLILIVSMLRGGAVEVETDRAVRGDLSVTIDEDGRVRVRDRYVVASPVTGRVERIELREGDAVARGQVLARVAPPPLDARTREEARARIAAAEARLGEATARLAQARSARDQAVEAWRRREAIAGMGALSEEERQRFRTDAALAEEAVTAAEAVERAVRAELAAARASLAGERAGATLDVIAPVAGRVLRIPVRSERVVGAGEILVELGIEDVLEVVVDVLSADAVRIDPGARAWLEGWGGDSALLARVALVEPSAFTRVSALGVEEQRVNVILQLPDAPPALGDGYRVEARIEVWSGENRLLASAAAIFRRGEQWHVFAVRSGRARLAPLRLGARGTLAVEVLEGLEEGDVVVLYPSDRVSDGVRVRAQPR